jgi:hypothetical protein
MLAVLLAVVAVGYVGIIPAQAANRDTKTETVVTYMGYTLSWSKPDASDLRVVRTPGRSEALPDAAIKRSIQQAKSRVTTAAQQQLSEDPTDSCNFVPDSFGAANFTSACNEHDDCYSYPAQTSRLECDTKFLRDLNAACVAGYPTDPRCCSLALRSQASTLSEFDCSALPFTTSHLRPVMLPRPQPAPDW